MIDEGVLGRFPIGAAFWAEPDLDRLPADNGASAAPDGRIVADATLDTLRRKARRRVIVEFGSETAAQVESKKIAVATILA